LRAFTKRWRPTSATSSTSLCCWARCGRTPDAARIRSTPIAGRWRRLTLKRTVAALGCAAANRLIARVDEAFSALAEAEPPAGARADDRALPKHYLRGNLHLPAATCRNAAANTRCPSRRRIA
jgi:hypothetical protein